MYKVIKHDKGKNAFVYTCNSCKAAVEIRYHCNVCDDFDLCIPCYKKERHHHEMTKLGLGLDDIGSSGKEENPQEPRRGSIQCCATTLLHACQCKNADCLIYACRKMKVVVAHTLRCSRKTNNACLICKQMITLCSYHAKHCTENECPVPFCSQLKHELRQLTGMGGNMRVPGIQQVHPQQQLSLPLPQQQQHPLTPMGPNAVSTTVMSSAGSASGVTSMGVQNMLTAFKHLWDN